MTARVLVVDDILSNVKLLEAKLSAEYFEVVSAYNGLEALAKIAEHAPDIVLLDVMMPGMDGFEVCRRIKSDPKTAYIPVVMVTTLDQPSDRVAGLDAGAVDFLTKPVDDRALFARVRSLVRLKMMTDELHMRETTGQSMGLLDPVGTLQDGSATGRILIIEDRPESVQWFASALAPANEVSSVDTFEETLVRVRVPAISILSSSASACVVSTAFACVHPASLDPGNPQHADPRGGERRRSPQAHPGAGDGRQRLSGRVL